jgi:osmotically-inducible protein OsmY
MLGIFMKTDIQIQQDIEDELKWDTTINDTQVRVVVSDGDVTLYGRVPVYSDKVSAEMAANRIGGVKAITNAIHVEISDLDARTDADLTQVALKVWDWNARVPKGLQLRVDHGWITLRGHVDWEFQRNVAEDSLTSLMGVRGIDNLISLGDGTNLFVGDDFWGRVPLSMQYRY